MISLTYEETNIQLQTLEEGSSNAYTHSYLPYLFWDLKLARQQLWSDHTLCFTLQGTTEIFTKPIQNTVRRTWKSTGKQHTVKKSLDVTGLIFQFHTMTPNHEIPKLNIKHKEVAGTLMTESRICNFLLSVKHWNWIWGLRFVFPFVAYFFWLVWVCFVCCCGVFLFVLKLHSLLNKPNNTGVWFSRTPVQGVHL